jgi:general secretion pathway protein L
MATLIVTLPLVTPGAGTEFDYVLTTDELTISRHGRATASQLPPLPGAGHKVVAVVQARALSWHRVTLPKTLLRMGPVTRGSQTVQLRSALEGLLEDQLLDEPALLHFALAPQTTEEQSIWVAACDRAWLRASLQILEQVQRSASLIVPEFAPTAATSHAALELHVTAGLAPAQLVFPNPHGVTVMPLDAAAAALLALPNNATIVAEPGSSALAEQLFKRQVVLQTESQRWLQSARTEWNLAQFDLARSNRTRALKNLALGWNSFRHAPKWRASRWMLGLLLAFNLIGLNALAWKERSALELKQAKIRDTLLQAFPEVKVVLDAPLQMEREVSALQLATGTASQHGLEAMLTSLSSASSTPLSPSEIEFASGQAHLKGLQLTTEEATNLETRMQASGYAMRIEGNVLVVRVQGAP